MEPENRAAKYCADRGFEEADLKFILMLIDDTREQCAKIAQEYKPWVPVGLEIAQAIRARRGKE